jgi:uncharacterized Zn finger protein
MFHHIHQEIECSKCGTKNYTETVTRDNETIRRCRKCGHEKVISTHTRTEATTVYTNKPNEPEIF